MLLLMMELKGRFNSKMIKRAKFGDVYFDDMGGFDSVEKDRVTGSVSNSRVLFSNLSDDICVRMLSAKSTSRSQHAICVRD
jgi:serine/threonine-protein kinase PRP4